LDAGRRAMSYLTTPEEIARVTPTFWKWKWKSFLLWVPVRPKEK
jgi:hypothetical protein